jgi:glycosyltransferase involved in cell wall biosynthesis
MAAKKRGSEETGERKLAQAIRFAGAALKQQIADRLRQATLDHQDGRLDSAARGYRQVLSVESGNSQALNNLSLLLADNQQAIDLLSKALHGRPDYLDALINLSVRYVATGDAAEANTILNRASELAPSDTRVHQILASLSDARLEKGDLSSKAPYFTVIIPTHQRPTLLNRTLASLRAQSPEVSLEIIVVADIADIETEAVCQRWLSKSDTYIRRNGKPGPSESRNLGLRLSHGAVILFLDDDDAWHPGLLSQLSQLETLRNGQPVYFNCSVIKERRTPEGPVHLTELSLNTRGILNQDVYVKNQVHMSCFAFPAWILRDIYFDPHMRAYEDWDFLLSVCDRQMPEHADILGSKVYEVNDETSDRRGNSRAANDFNAILDYLYVYRRHPVIPEIQQKRASLLASTGFSIPANYI